MSRFHVPSRRTASLPPEPAVRAHIPSAWRAMTPEAKVEAVLSAGAAMLAERIHPSNRALAGRLGVSRPTVNAIVAGLRRDGRCPWPPSPRTPSRHARIAAPAASLDEWRARAGRLLPPAPARPTARGDDPAVIELVRRYVREMGAILRRNPQWRHRPREVG